MAILNAGASLLLRAHKSSSQDGVIAPNKGSGRAKKGGWKGTMSEGSQVVEGNRVVLLEGRAAC